MFAQEKTAFWLSCLSMKPIICSSALQRCYFLNIDDQISKTGFSLSWSLAIESTWDHKSAWPHKAANIGEEFTKGRMHCLQQIRHEPLDTRLTNCQSRKRYLADGGRKNNKIYSAKLAVSLRFVVPRSNQLWMHNTMNDQADNDAWVLNLISQFQNEITISSS